MTWRCVWNPHRSPFPDHADRASEPEAEAAACEVVARGEALIVTVMEIEGAK